MKKNSMKRILFILHRSPPVHGAAIVGDFISYSKKLNQNFECKFITIKSSDTIGDIGKVNLKKFYLVAELYVKILYALLFFRPSKLYFTASVSSVAFYRDVLLSTLWKGYRLFRKLDIYYHYHTKGIDSFVSASKRNLKLTNFFIKDVNIILLSPLLSQDLKKLTAYKDILFLPNGVENSYTDEEEFNSYIEKKDFDTINILYLSNMIKSKGYFEVLKLAKHYKDKKYHFHFAGEWQSDKGKEEFFQFIEDNTLRNNVTFHGFVNGEQKKKLFEMSHIFVFPTQYESFGMVVIEAFSYGLPVLSTKEGSIPYIVDERCGVLIGDMQELERAFYTMCKDFINIETAKVCRKKYIDNFTLNVFEEKLVSLLKKDVL